MKNVSFIALLSLLMLLLAQPIKAAIKFPAIVSSNMVLQRNTTITLWGWANPKEKITIQASWFQKPLKIAADNQGNWSVEVQTTNSKAQQTIKMISRDSEILLENILFGEVWLCSGQSNMGQPVAGNIGQPTFGANMAIAKSANPNLRLFTVKKHGSQAPLEDLQKYTAWQAASPESIPTFSAVAYFFGQQLQEVLDVPIGLIQTSWGASNIQAWMSKDALDKFQNVNIEELDITAKTNRVPTALFNAMINPITQYTIKGALWYQGEANRKEPEKYKTLFPAMVKDWRQRWAIGDFPFYFVQIAPYLYGNQDAFQTPTNTAFMREVQLHCLDLIPNSGIAVTIDIGDRNTIHPPKKKEVADRLLFNALNQTYGYQTVAFAGPIVASHELKDGGIVLKFKNAERGLYSYDKLKGFEIAGEDKIFHPANGKIINRKTVIVKSDQVPNPVAVRYAWRNWVVGTLYNANLLPASSFRTDTWDDATQVAK